jgi:sec-independent protein translocase protein TatA
MYNVLIAGYREGGNMFGLGLPELLIILVIVVLLFGAGKLPQIGSGIGEGIRNFKKSMKEKNEVDVTPAKTDDSKK